jgi:HYR domain
MRRLAAAFAVVAALMVAAGSGASTTTGTANWSGNDDRIVAAVNSSGGPATINVTATDQANASLSVTCNQASGTFPLGDTPVHCDASDGGGLVGTTDFTITVKDQTNPVVSVPSDITDSTGNAGGKAESFTVTATDNVDGSLTPGCSPASGSIFPIGQTTVSCTATDAAGNHGSASFKVTLSLLDTTPPVVTVPGPMNVNATGPSTPVSFSVSANDAVDGSVPVSCTPQTGSGFPVGQTTVNCSAVDSSNNVGHGSFTVTVHDVTAPQLTVPADQTVGATSPNGAVVTYSAQASDNVDGAITPSCSPPSGSVFPAKPPGPTTLVTCTATDAANNSTTKTFHITVNDSAPILTHVNDIVAEANGPNGAVITYTAPSATDIVDGGLAVTCVPASGSTFALGATTVNCSAKNSSNQTGTTSFGVLVRDTTPPVMPVPGSISLTSDSPVPATNDIVARFLNVRATDLVDPSPRVRSNAPGMFPIGRTTVTFTATDKSGNTSTASGTVVVVQAQSPTSAPVVTPGTTPPDRTPPANVRNLTIRVSGRSALLRWRLPKADFDHVVVFRSAGGKKAVAVYRGAKTSFVDHRLKMGVVYRYLVVAVDKTGNQSAGVAALARPTAQLLYGPASGQRVTSPVVLRWQAKAGASFYNVQLYRAKTKVLSVWPKKAKVVLNARWSYGGKAQKLLPGRYTWYVWPARGTRKTPKYQALEGFNSFVVVNA